MFSFRPTLYLSNHSPSNNRIELRCRPPPDREANHIDTGTLVRSYRICILTGHDCVTGEIYESACPFRLHIRERQL